MFVVIRAHLRHCACPTNAHIHFSMLRFVSLRPTTTSATFLTTNPSAQPQGVLSKGASAALCLSAKCSHTLQYLRFVSLRPTTTSATLLTTNPSAQPLEVLSKGASAALCLSDKCSHTLQYAALCQPATHYHICNFSSCLRQMVCQPVATDILAE